MGDDSMGDTLQQDEMPEMVAVAAPQ